MKNFETKQLLIDANKLKDLSGFAFVMAITDAKSRLKKEQEVLDEMRKPSKEFEDYQEEAREINKKYSHKDEKGEAKIITKTYGDQTVQFFDIDKDQEEARKKEMDKLEKKSKELIDEQIAKDKKYQEAMNECSTLELKEISEKQVPKNITVEQMEIALRLIKIK